MERVVQVTVNRPISLEAKAWLEHVAHVLNEQLPDIERDSFYLAMYKDKLVEYFETGQMPKWTGEDLSKLEERMRVRF